MREETSYGIIPLKKESNEWVTLLVQHQAGHWGFPKGHPEPDETPEETAARELQEETGLSVVEFLKIDPIQETYTFDDIRKTVIYSAAMVEGELCEACDEIQAKEWVKLDEAEGKISFTESKRICRTIHKLLSA